MSNSLRPRGLHTAYQASLSITNFQSLLTLMSIESVMHPIVCVCVCVCVHTQVSKIPTRYAGFQRM